VIISGHGGSARALVKLISKLPDEEIKELNLPHTTPLVYNFEI
jgi:2,3-bisphosphoglycerate-dependent phosphoglycerate mutase